MNLRIAAEQIRFRITADEFAEWLRVGILEAGVELPARSRLDYALRLDAADRSDDGQTLALTVDAAPHGMRFVLTVFADGVARLQSGQTDKDGLREHLVMAGGAWLSVGLEIDLHSKQGSA